MKHFGGIDIVINNASAINLTGTQETSMKKYDLMHSINTRLHHVFDMNRVPAVLWIRMLTLILTGGRGGESDRHARDLHSMKKYDLMYY